MNVPRGSPRRFRKRFRQPGRPCWLAFLSRSFKKHSAGCGKLKLRIHKYYNRTLRSAVGKASTTAGPRKLNLEAKASEDKKKKKKGKKEPAPEGKDDQPSDDQVREEVDRFVAAASSVSRVTITEVHEHLEKTFKCGLTARKKFTPALTRGVINECTSNIVARGAWGPRGPFFLWRWLFFLCGSCN